MTASVFRILTVCTGNICRSPLAEQYLRVGLESKFVEGIVLESAGTDARDGQRMPDQAQALSRRYGAVPDAHEARFLMEGHIAQADLVLVMGREHRRAVVSQFPRASRYTFTLREFARLAEGMVTTDLDAAAALPIDDVKGRLREAVMAVASRRGTVEGPDSPLDDDVVDPYRRSDEVYEESGRQLVPAADVVIQLLAVAARLRTGESEGE
ncbi:arsenate reductase/protein-tyrosine-phosphatase family protein [Frigoribacterium salinisoli]